jgi:hypothetical protein
MLSRLVKPRFAHSLSLRICLWPADALAAGTFAPALRAWRIAALSAESSRILAAESDMGQRWASPAPPGSSAAELPADAQPLVFERLGGDVAALCASACVSKSWHDKLLSTSEPWQSLVAGRAASRISDARLLSLAARSRGELRRLDVSGCTFLTDAGVASVLAGQPSLAHFAAVGCYNLTVRGLAAALKDHAKLDSLRVRGLNPGGRGGKEFALCDAGDKDAVWDLVKRERVALKKLLKKPYHLDAWAGCTYAFNEPDHGYDSEGLHDVCGCMCSEEDRVCDSCFTYCCMTHRSVPAEGEPDDRCTCCGARACENCIEAEEVYGEELMTGHACSSCSRRHCVECVQLDRVQPFTVCGGCDESVCDACVQSGKHSGICNWHRR